MPESGQMVDWILRGGRQWLRMVREASGEATFTPEQLHMVREFKGELEAVLSEQERRK